MSHEEIGWSLLSFQKRERITAKGNGGRVLAGKKNLEKTNPAQSEVTEF